MDKEQESLIEIFAEERSRRDAEEDILRNRLKVGKIFFSSFRFSFLISPPFVLFFILILVISFFSERDLFVVGCI